MTMTMDLLKTKSKKDLALLADQNEISGWQAMTKEQLLASLLKHAKSMTKKASATNGTSKKASNAAKPASASRTPSSQTTSRRSGVKSTTKPIKAATAPPPARAEANGHSAICENGAEQPVKSTRRVRQPEPRPQSARAAARRVNGAGASVEEQVERSKYFVGVPTRDLSQRLPKDVPGGYGKDRIVTMVRDPYWLHVYWELTRQAISRAEAALAQDWYAAKPILRLLDVTADDATSASEGVVRDIEIHGGVDNWYINVENPPRSFRVDIGYLTARGRFFVIARSNVVTTPKPGVSGRIDENWRSVQDDFERIYAMSGGYDPRANNEELRNIFEERLRRPMSSGSLSDYGSGALSARRGFHFNIDAELIVYGNTDPSARVTLQGEPVQLRPDGSFTMRFSLPDGRQILPAVAQTYDGIEERTIILAIERNTKELEPMVHDGQE